MNPIKQKSNVLTKAFEIMIGLAGTKYNSASMSVVQWQQDLLLEKLMPPLFLPKASAEESTLFQLSKVSWPHSTHQLFKRPHWDDRKFLLATVT